MIISVTQYIAPHGERRTGYIEVPDAEGRQAKYNELMEQGCNITGEVRSPGAVSSRYEIVTTITSESLENDFKTHITPHPTDGGPSAHEAAGVLIDKWDLEEFLTWKAGILLAQDA